MFKKLKSKSSKFFVRVARFGLWNTLNGKARKKELAELADCRSSPNWRTANGTIVPIHHLSDEHLLNAIAYVKKQQFFNPGWRKHVYPNLVLEAKLRNLIPLDHPDTLDGV